MGEVDLATGLGERRLAEVIRHTGPLDPPRALVPWGRLAWLLLAAVGLLLLALR